MLQEIKLIIKENGKLIDSITKTIDSPKPSKLIESLQEFQLVTNDVLTKMVEASGNDVISCSKSEGMYIY